MSGLPEWLWPLEDEVAVQEAERLIDETHTALQRMEADIRIQSFGQHLTDKTEKLKNVVNRKIQKLEKELMGTTKPARSAILFSKRNLPYKSGESKIASKVNHDPKDQREAPILQVGQSSLMHQRKNSHDKGNASTAEEVVLTARAKVQDALAVARNVSASLEQHASGPSLNGKILLRSQTRNVGVFEIKSLKDEKKMQIFKPRLEHALLPTISIKSGLERQSIPSIVVAPGEKIVPSNVSVHNIQHCDKEKTSVESKINVGNHKQKKISAHQEKQQSINDSDVAFAQLSKQLAQIEELREVNQTQVNHVLRFLLSRVCKDTDTPDSLVEKTFTYNQEMSHEKKEKSPALHSSTSDSSRYSIAYDSLSRFLETYKHAAEQSMLAKKRASIRRQKLVLKQKKDIELLRNAPENHLLNDPLQQITKSPEREAALDLQDIFYYSSSSSLHSLAKAQKSVSKGNTSDSILPCGTDFNADEETSPSPTQENPNSIIAVDSAMHSPAKTSIDISGEDYEDDWEEEEIDRKQEKDETVNSPADPSLQTVTEVEEKLSSSHTKNMENQKLHDRLASEPTDMFGKYSSSAPDDCSKQVNLYSESRSPVKIQDNNPVGKDSILVNHSEKIMESENVPYEEKQECKADSDICTQKVVTDAVIHLQPEGKSEELHCDSKLESASNTTKYVDRRRKLIRSKHDRTQARHTVSCSSSDGEANFQSAMDNSRQWELRLREDLQLQSAVLLNWQLEDRWNQKAKEGFSSQLNTQAPHKEDDVEMRWRETLDQLDRRLKAVEENERFSRLANDIRAQSREELTKSLISNAIKDVAQAEFLKISDKLAGIDIKVPTKEQTVQTQESNQINNLVCDTEFIRALPTFKVNRCKSPLPQNDLISSYLSSQHQAPSTSRDDLTAELLAYSRMGILASSGYPEQTLSKSSSSSTISSQCQRSSLMVSLSEGELRGSANGSCSCSDGELCVCRGQKLCSERAPPDGSQTLSYEEAFLKDLSQGEILPSEGDYTLKDTSHGEITGHIIAGVVSPQKHDPEENSESDIDWET